MTETKRSQRPDGRKARTRAALIEAAEKLFADRGPANTTVDDIAEAAGVSVGSLYVHFGSKDALLLEIIDGAIATHVRYIDDARSGGSPLARVLQAGDAFFRFAMAEPIAFRYVTMRAVEPEAGPARDEATRRITRRVEQVLGQIAGDLQEAMDAGEIDQASVEEAMVFLWGSWSGVASLVLRAEHDPLAVPQEVAERALIAGRQVLVRGLGGDAEAYGAEFRAAPVTAGADDEA